MIKNIYLAIATIILSSCYSYLPHTSIAEGNATLITPVYQGQDTSHFYGGLGFSETQIYNSNQEEIVIQESDLMLRAALFELG